MATVLRDGTVVDESINAHNFTPRAQVPAAFKCGARRIEGITIHHWGLEGQKFDGVVAYLASDNPRGSSAHAVIMAGRAASIVDTMDAAWHAGNALGNTTTIGLELRPEATDGDYQTAAAYIAMLWDVYGEIPLIPHNYWKSTACPGKWNLTRLANMAREFRLKVTPQGGTTITPTDGKDISMATAKEVADEIFNRLFARQGGVEGTTNLGGLVAWMDANLKGIPVNVANHKFVNQYGTELTVGEQLGHIDKNLNDYFKALNEAVANVAAPVVLSGDDVQAIANTLKETLAPAVVAELARRLSE
jgi:hypothetical protein